LEYSGGLVEVAKAISFGRNELDFIKMADYARRNGNRAAGKRLGYLLEKLDIKADTAVGILRENLGSSYALLDALADPQGQHIQRWRIIANIPEKELMQWKVVG
jgi:predicted transcriptional regulator of viral defense system